VAITGALFKALENARLDELLSSAGVTLTGSEQAEVHGLLSGSDAALAKLSEFGAPIVDRLDSIVRELFVSGLRGGMLLNLGLSIVGVLVALGAEPLRRRAKR